MKPEAPRSTGHRRNGHALHQGHLNSISLLLPVAVQWKHSSEGDNRKDQLTHAQMLVVRPPRSNNKRMPRSSHP